ncbi:restriction endonuclease subunit S [Tenuifilum sp.]|uniref:restriction endonuclease subunit S n=1 Tax=Tenuifilum sp. TaxID=2760880 RepID=UPI001B6CD67D|nr:restriction endonuclease subunit S [Bacteroidales bacterium]HOJ66558.1 restriction endonuclease subunit S [Paludibacteraceae bacterium]HQE54279.1 restriction endonuclease subunit S [Tenuifilum sp.]HPD59492.1 restriction endonuclease subunit S [Paludibacteraceae bacterium]HQI88263.1 restriction endonuclease subunit S [Tenuifilum sp.]
MGWVKIKLSDVIKNREGRYKPNDPAIKGLKRIDKINFLGQIFLSDKNSNTDMILIKKGDLVISGINVEKGALAIYEGEENILATIHYSSYIFDKTKVDIDFLKIFLRSPDFIQLLKEQVPGGIKTEIKPKHILSLEVYFPETTREQKAIAQLFFEREAKLILLNKDLSHQLTLLENLNQAILQEAVQGKLVQQDPKDEPATELLKRIKAEKAKSGKNEKPLPPIKPEEIPFEIPSNWVWCRLGEIIEYTDNLDIQKHLSPDTIINYVDIDAIDNHNFVIREAKQKTVRELSTRARRVLKPNFIAYSTVRPYLKNIAVIEDDLENYIGSTGFNVFKTLNVELKYAFYYLLTPYVNNSFKDLMVGFNSPSITNDQFEKSLFPLPPLSEQKRIVAEIEKQLAKTKQLKEHIIANQQATEQLLKALLHQAFEVEEMEEVNS